MEANTKKPQVSAYKSLRPVFRFLKPYKAMVAFALLALIITAGISLSLGQGVKLVIDNGFIAGSEAQLKASIFTMLGLVCLMAIGTFTRFYLMSWLGERVVADLRKAVFTHVVNMHPSYFEENRSGEIMSRLTSDTALLQSIFGSSFSMALRSMLTFSGGLIMLIITNAKLSFFVLAVIPAVLIPIFFFGKRVRRLAEGSQAAVADVGTYAGEVIQNIKVVQSYTSEEREQQAFDKEVESAFEVAKKRIKQRSFLISIVIMLAFSAISIMLWVGGMDVLNNKITGGELGAFVFYALMVAMSVATIAEVYGQLQRAAGSATRLLELLEITSDIQSPDSPREINIGSSTKTSNSSTSNALSFENVSFHYPTRPDSAALKEINLDIKKGQVVAFVGTSGAGKSTLFELLQRFYDPQQGCIKINDCPLQEADVHALRRSMGTVAQQPVLFSANVWHNIRYGRPEASDEEVIDAARKAHAHEFIEQLPGGYASDLGEKGVRLSGGQKQRIALARAILKDPEILLLDEATSALDAESEYHVQQALNTLMTGRTTLIIAHRLATVLHADEIVVMSEGRIVDKGDHKSLLKSCAIYQRLCELQFDA